MGLISQNKVKIEGGMSSMTDLVFLLLIFFIILSALAKNAVDVDLPEGGSVAPTTQSLASIVVKPDNTILLNNKIIDISELEIGNKLYTSSIKSEKFSLMAIKLLILGLQSK